jgi:hypothetical protein
MAALEASLAAVKGDSAGDGKGEAKPKGKRATSSSRKKAAAK